MKDTPSEAANTKDTAEATEAAEARWNLIRVLLVLKNKFRKWIRSSQAERACGRSSNSPKVRVLRLDVLRDGSREETSYD